MKLARSRGCGFSARCQCSAPTMKVAFGNSSSGAHPSRHGASRPPAWSKWRWLSTTTSMSSCEKPAARGRIQQHAAVFLHAEARAACSKNAPMPVSNSTVLPLSGCASSARHASSMRFSASGGDHFSHMARGALPNIAPPSSFWELPSSDQSFMARILRLPSATGADSTTLAAPTGLRGSLPPISVLVVLSHSTVCRATLRRGWNRDCPAHPVAGHLEPVAHGLKRLLRADSERRSPSRSGRGESGKHAVTHYRTLERLGYVSVVECVLETGRTHQIRVHMKHIGAHPSTTADMAATKYCAAPPMPNTDNSYTTASRYAPDRHCTPKHWVSSIPAREKRCFFGHRDTQRHAGSDSTVATIYRKPSGCRRITLTP